MKIYCLPYAGGSKSIYYDWTKEYADIGEIIPIEYNGHGELFCEPFYNSMDEASDDIFKRISNDKPVDYVIFGHSFGSMTALLTAEKLEQKYYKKPRAVIVGGMRPPHLKYKDKKLLNLSKDEFMQHFFDLGQTDEEIMNEPELIDIIYDKLYNDLRIEETYRYLNEEHHALSVPIITTTGSKDDEAPLEDMKEWSKYTTGPFVIKDFFSDHFFPFNCDDFKPYFRSLLKKISLSQL